MKKNTGMAYSVLAIAFVLFNVISFAIPTAKTATFWVAYTFSAIAFALQIGIWKFAFKSADTLKSKFLGIPLISVGITYLIVQIIAFAIFMAFPIAPTWIAIVVCALILGISAICLIGTETGREEINRVEEKVKAKRAFIQLLQVDIEMLVEAEADAETKAALVKLAEKVRFSDPMSHEMLGELESRITAKVDEMKATADKKLLIGEIDILLTERNKKCMFIKN